jgi:putative aldouronate transport system permease protein
LNTNDQSIRVGNRSKKFTHFKKNIFRSRYLYLMMFLPLVYFVLFKYIPMYGLLIAFKNFKIYDGILGSQWVGLKYFTDFFTDPYSLVIIKNTILLGFWLMVFAFPAPIIFALLVNEIRRRYFKKMVQSISYLPYFLSMVVLVSMMATFLSVDGLINTITGVFGVEPVSYLLKKEWFRTLFVISDIWQTLGWSSIIYLAALSGVDPEQIEASVIDGAGRFKQLMHITLPAITPTIIIMFILNMGNIMDISFEKVLLMQNSATYETADVISTYVFRRGLEGFEYSYATAVGLFNSVLNLVFLLGANSISKRLGGTSLW